MRRGQDVPAHAREVHPAAEERHKHGQKEITKPALRPDQRPVHSVCRGSCHRTCKFTIVYAVDGWHASSKSYTFQTNWPGTWTPMGNELKCNVRFGNQESVGKVLLETNEILFRGDFRLKMPFPTIKSVKAANGELRVETSEGLAVFELREAAEKWRDKILYPKSRLEKLGVKPGAKVSLFGDFEAEFLREVSGLTKSLIKSKVTSDSESIFFAADSREGLAALSKISKSMQGATALWIVYPKGQKHITENDVLSAGRKCGLKDVKVVGFSSLRTALKFVIPLSQR